MLYYIYIVKLYIYIHIHYIYIYIFYGVFLQIAHQQSHESFALAQALGADIALTSVVTARVVAYDLISVLRQKPGRSKI